MAYMVFNYHKQEKKAFDMQNIQEALLKTWIHLKWILFRVTFNSYSFPISLRSSLLDNEPFVFCHTSTVLKARCELQSH